MFEILSLFPVWQLWLVAALLLFALEVITPGFILACFGLGALLYRRRSWNGAGWCRSSASVWVAWWHSGSFSQ